MIGNKSFDIRTNKGGEVSLKEGGRHEFVAALDFASMYPYVAESSTLILQQSSRTNSLSNTRNVSKEKKWKSLKI